MCRALLRFPHLSFIPPVPYPPLRGTFPSRGRLCIGDSDTLVYDALETIFSLSFIPLVPYPARFARVLVYRLLETISPLFFIPLVPYPPLRGTFPLRGRLYVEDSDARVYDALETIFSLSFIPPVPYPPLRGTFPSRGRLCSSALVFLRILYSLWRYRLMVYHASILRKQKPLCEDGLCRAVSGSIILRSRILRDFSAYPHHFLS